MAGSPFANIGMGTGPSLAQGALQNPSLGNATINGWQPPAQLPAYDDAQQAALDNNPMGPGPSPTSAPITPGGQSGYGNNIGSAPGASSQYPMFGAVAASTPYAQPSQQAPQFSQPQNQQYDSPWSLQMQPTARGPTDYPSQGGQVPGFQQPTSYTY